MNHQTSESYQGLAALKPDPIPVNLNDLAVNPDVVLSRLADEIAAAVTRAIRSAAYNDIELMDCQARWVNIPDFERNPEAVLGSVQMSFLGRRPTARGLDTARNP